MTSHLKIINGFKIGWFVDYIQFMEILNPFVLLLLFKIRCPVKYSMASCYIAGDEFDW